MNQSHVCAGSCRECGNALDSSIRVLVTWDADPTPGIIERTVAVKLRFKGRQIECQSHESGVPHAPCWAWI
jgi:hypothetical protein